MWLTVELYIQFKGAKKNVVDVILLVGYSNDSTMNSSYLQSYTKKVDTLLGKLEERFKTMLYLTEINAWGNGNMDIFKTGINNLFQETSHVKYDSSSWGLHY